MSPRFRLRALSTVAALGLLALAASPAAAATEVARGAASAATVTVAGNAQGSGTYDASNDGTTQTTSGTNAPAATVLGGFPGAGAGTLNQDAGTTTGSQASACAGLAGNGATLVAVGRSSCLQPKDTLALNAGSVDLTTFDPTNGLIDSAFNKAILAQVPGADPAAVSALTTPLTMAFQMAFSTLGNPTLSFNLGVIQGSCTAEPGNANGAANLVGAKLVASFQGTDLPLLDLPVNPDPNTKITADLGPLVAKAIDAAKASFMTSTSSNTALAPLFAALAPLNQAFDQSKVLTDGLTTITSQLGPLDQVISGTLNKQTRPNDSSIDVTALDLQVLPAASTFVGSSLASLEIGHVSCAAAPRVAAPVAAPVVNAAVPSVVDSGLPGRSDSRADLYRTLLGALLLVGAGGIAVRRLLITRSSD